MTFLKTYRRLKFFSFFGILGSSLSITEVIVVFVVLIKLDFKSAVEKIVFFTRFRNSGAPLQVARLVNLIWNCIVDNWLAERHNWLTIHRIVLTFEISEGAKRNLHIPIYKILRKARFKFHKLAFELDVIYSWREKMFTRNRLFPRVITISALAPIRWVWNHEIFHFLHFIFPFFFEDRL